MNRNETQSHVVLAVVLLRGYNLVQETCLYLVLKLNSMSSALTLLSMWCMPGCSLGVLLFRLVQAKLELLFY